MMPQTNAIDKERKNSLNFGNLNLTTMEIPQIEDFTSFLGFDIRYACGIRLRSFEKRPNQ